MHSLVSRAHCNTECCNADPGPSFSLFEASWVPDRRRIARAARLVRDTLLCALLVLMSGASSVKAQSPDTWISWMSLRPSNSGALPDACARAAAAKSALRITGFPGTRKTASSVIN